MCCYAVSHCYCAPSRRRRFRAGALLCAAFVRTLTTSLRDLHKPHHGRQPRRPWITAFNDCYYFITSGGTENLTIYKSATLDDFHGIDPVLVWTFSNPDLGDVWAPELHRIDREWYIYCALPDGPDDADRRMHVLKGNDASDPLQPYEDLGAIGTPDENYAIDGTVLQGYNGRNYTAIQVVSTS
ncbi:glycosyl hydrolase [Schizophyllum amplum]|uniref:Glycosyl hydrolase n=1 Tax=Schizophyllum amplum TaxID=97359 RepID=A0A550CRQ7_9AGAR|nr:glycosyl hydrolase [Auriculariopsis ampla]